MTGQGPVQDGLLDVLQHAGISVLWKTAAAARGVQNVPAIEIEPKAFPAYCSGSTCVATSAIVAGAGSADRRHAGQAGRLVAAASTVGSHGRYHPSPLPGRRSHLPAGLPAQLYIRNTTQRAKSW